MAFTKQEHDNLLMEIAKSGGDTPKMLELMQKLRDDFDEREGELKRYRETEDKRPPEGTKEEERKIVDESQEDNREDGGERRRAYGVAPDRRGVSVDTVSRADYEDLKQKYIERFFSSIPEAIREQKEDIRKDDRVDDLTFEDLFKEREG